jgi:hypothetical protein
VVCKRLKTFDVLGVWGSFYAHKILPRVLLVWNTLKEAEKAHGTGLTSPFVVIPGSYTSQSWTTTWEDGEPRYDNPPAYALITAVDTNGLSYTAEETYTGDWASVWPVAIIGTTQYDSIQAAIDAAVVGDNLIMVYPANHGTDSIDIIQREGVNITLEAVGEVVLKNQIQIDGNGRSNGAESLTINGFTFDFSDKSGDIITTVKGDDQNMSILIMFPSKIVYLSVILNLPLLL